ncbi:MAG TPA: glycosyltransferase family 39 protein [Dehalococcoidia bacterium]|nr:glycosyltransferase family 39 protein [Dehalococcoidia bacterium]
MASARGAWLPWIGLIALGLAARLAALRFVANYTQPWPWEAEIMAQHLVERGTLAFDFYGLTPPLPTAFLPPVYPLFIAAIRWVVGPDYLSALQLAQVAISLVAVALLVPIAREVTGSRPASWAAGVIAAVYPVFIMNVAQVNTVSLEVLWIEVFVGALFLWARRPSALGWLALAGLGLGLLALTRGPALLIWPVVGVWLLLVYPGRALHRRILWVAVFSALLILPLVPWTLRNSAVLSAPVTIATNGGVNFWIGHNPWADGEYAWPIETDRALAEQAAQLSEPQRDALYYRLGLEYAQSHPAEEVALSLRKLWYFIWFRPNLGSSYPNAEGFQVLAQTALMGSYAVVGVAAVFGLWLTRSRWRRLFVIYGLWVAYGASAVMYFSATRFRAPVEPFLIVFAGAGATWAFDRLKTKSRRRKADLAPRADHQMRSAPAQEARARVTLD